MAVNLQASEADRNVRSNLADDIERYWVGHTTTCVGVQYLDLKDGLVVKGRYSIERADIFCFQDYDRGVNVFVDIDGYPSIQPWSDKKQITPAEKKSIERQVAAALSEQAEYVAFETKFLTEKPWTQVYGMTPEDAVASLRKWAENAGKSRKFNVQLLDAHDKVIGEQVVYEADLVGNAALDSSTIGNAALSLRVPDRSTNAA